MNSISGQSIKELYNNIIGYELIYLVLIFIIPLIGLISSNIYTSIDSENWYNNITFTLPDISHGSYGLYISLYIYILAGGTLILIYRYMTKNYLDVISESNVINRKIFPYAFYLIPILFLLIYIANPIMYQSKSLLSAGILYIFASIISIFILYLTFLMDNVAKWLWLIFVIWLIYITIFYFSAYSPENASLIYNDDNLPPPPILIPSQENPHNLQNQEQIKPSIINNTNVDINSNEKKVEVI